MNIILSFSSCLHFVFTWLLQQPNCFTKDITDFYSTVYFILVLQCHVGNVVFETPNYCDTMGQKLEAEQKCNRIYDYYLSAQSVSLEKKAEEQQILQNDCRPSEDSYQPVHLCSLISLCRVPCWKQHEPHHDKTNNMACAPSEDSHQHGHPPSLISLHFALSG